MKKDAHLKIERYRFHCPGHPLHSTFNDGNNGVFNVPSVNDPALSMRIVVSDGSGWEKTGMPPPAWEHVSASFETRCPCWQEMCSLKDMFWEEDECVMQYHPPKSDYVNYHPYCLHLWKPIGVEFPCPHWKAVGPK